MARCSYINAQQVRQLALDLAAKERAHRFERVSADFLDAINAEVVNLVRKRVQSHPSVGKTLK